VQVAIRLVEQQNRDAQHIVLKFLGGAAGNALLHRFAGILDAAASAAAQEGSGRVPAGRSEREGKAMGAAMQRLFLGVLAPAADVHAGGADVAVCAKVQRHTACVLVMRFLQQCCEGHLADMQAMMLAQPMHFKSVNLLHSAVALVQALARDELHMAQRVRVEDVQVLVRALDFVIDCVQATNLDERGNLHQAFVCESGLLTILNQLLAVHMHAAGEVIVKDEGGVAMLKLPAAKHVVALNWCVSVKQLKGRCATLLHALVEGCSDQAQFELLASEVSPAVLNARRKQLFLMAEHLRAAEQQAEAAGEGAEGAQTAPAMRSAELASVRRLILWVKPDDGADPAAGAGSEAEALLQRGLAPGGAAGWEAEFLAEGDTLLMFSETLAQRCPQYAAAQVRPRGCLLLRVRVSLTLRCARAVVRQCG
jgi:outer membrane murein-binding lipoprotein Lpp